jgi:hypothetical protein
MPLNSKLREQKLTELQKEKKDKPYSFKELNYKNTPCKLPVYEIPTEYLIFNQYNGRIGTYVKTYEKQNGTIDAETDEGEKIIYNFLLESKKKRNLETQKSIVANGQLEYGIVTKDGIIIDGNRRCMLLKKIAKENKQATSHFRAVILDDTLNNAPKEIRELETTYQMGVDEKVDYNAIEKYLKCKDLKEDFSEEQIAKMMGEQPSDIKNYLTILELMDEYLKRLGCSEIYTRLDEETVEGPFVDLRGYLERQETGKNIHKRDWTPKKPDIDDLKKVYFDYIRAGFRTAHGIRDIGNPSKGKGIFNSKKIWDQFITDHFNSKKKVTEKSLDAWRKEKPNLNITDLVRARDMDWEKQIKDDLKRNLNLSQRKVEDQEKSDSPVELLIKALNTLNAIDDTVPTFYSEEVLELVKEINSKTWDFKKKLGAKNATNNN